jgi:hypothetical protein
MAEWGTLFAHYHSQNPEAIV